MKGLLKERRRTQIEVCLLRCAFFIKSKTNTFKKNIFFFLSFLLINLSYPNYIVNNHNNRFNKVISVLACAYSS